MDESGIHAADGFGETLPEPASPPPPASDSRAPAADGRCQALHPSGERCILPAAHDGVHRRSAPAAPAFNWQAGVPQGSVHGGLSASKHCVACGSLLVGYATTCDSCHVIQPSLGAPPKDRLVAATFALMLGIYGLHKFYLGKIWQGIAYVVFSWTFIPWIIAWVEGIRYLLRSNEDWAAEYGGPVQSPNSTAIGCLWIFAVLPLLAIVGFVGLIAMGREIANVLSSTGHSI